VTLKFRYGQSDRRKAVCCPAEAKIYCSQIGCRTPKASFAELQRPEHDVLSFSVEAKNVQRMYECLLTHAYAYQWCLEGIETTALMSYILFNRKEEHIFLFPSLETVWF
jgi:hypothetical protein